MTTDPTPASQNHPAREDVSALVDGALAPQALAAGFDQWADRPEAREAWREYHLIGEVLRSGEHAPGAGSIAFAQRVTQRIALEIQAQAPAGAELAGQAGQAGQAEQAHPSAGAVAANDAAWRWRATALAASCVAVLAVAWNLWGAWGPGGEDGGDSPSLAASPAPMIRDPQLDELLAAHRQVIAQRAAQARPRLDGFERVNAGPQDWRVKAAPSGFQPVACWRRDETDIARLQCLYSDGQALVSVLAEPYDQRRHAGFAAPGNAPAQTRRIQNWWVTVLGEVPPHKLRAMARALERQP